MVIHSLEADVNGLQIDYDTYRAEREDLRLRVAQLVSLVEAVVNQPQEHRKVAEYVERISEGVVGVQLSEFPGVGDKQITTHMFARLSARRTTTAMVSIDEFEPQLMFEGLEYPVETGDKMAQHELTQRTRLEQADARRVRLLQTAEEKGGGVDAADQYDREVRLPMHSKAARLPLETILIANTPVRFDQGARRVIFRKDVGVRVTRFLERVNIRLVVFPGAKEAALASIDFETGENELTGEMVGREDIERIFQQFSAVGASLDNLKRPSRR